MPRGASCSRQRDGGSRSKTAKLLLDDANVLRSHAQQLLLCGVQRVEARVDVIVADAFTALFDADIAVDRGDLQQAADGALDGAIDRLLIAELVICHLQQRLERS